MGFKGFKVYLLGGKEYFEIKDHVSNESCWVNSKMVYTFPDTLLSFLYLDMNPWRQKIDAAFSALQKLRLEKDESDLSVVWELLSGLSKEHIYFECFRLNWYEWIRQAKEQQYMGARYIPIRKMCQVKTNVQRTQQQLLQMFHDVLSDESGDDSISRKLRRYEESGCMLERFEFTPLTLRYEAVGSDDYTEVLYAQSMNDVIEYEVRQCLARGIKMRRCKNCGKYFAVTGHASTEYCDRVFDDKGRTCKDVGAFRQYSRTHKDDAVFCEYRREYKRRFAWIKSGRISDNQFYAWSEQAREQKKKCDNKVITIEAFSDWLKKS